MPIFAIPPVPVGVPLRDPTTGLASLQWQAWYIAIQRALAASGGLFAPADARYVVTTSDATLTNEQNLGALATGYVFQTQAIGIATLSTLSAIPGGDVSGAALSRTNDTNVTLTLGGTPLTALLRAASLTLGWTGLLGLVRGGTAADLSATGGTSRVLRQSSVGAAVTVSQLASTDISGLASGTYTPTLANAANLSASTAYKCQYARVGTVVTVSGRVDVDPTTTATDTQLDISLPIASNFAVSNDCGGTAACPAIAGQVAAIRADVTGDVARMQWIAGDVTNQPMYFSFTYEII